MLFLCLSDKPKPATREKEDGEIVKEAKEARLAERAQAPASSELTARQRARMADLSLLLDVILKTHGTTAKREFCNCGVLHQLQVGPAPSSDPLRINSCHGRLQLNHTDEAVHHVAGSSDCLHPFIHLKVIPCCLPDSCVRCCGLPLSMSCHLRCL